jgi:hypothetical protein
MSTRLERDLWLYHTGELPERARARIEQELRTSEHLREALRQIRAADRALGELPVPRPERDLVARALNTADRRGIPGSAAARAWPVRLRPAVLAVPAAAALLLLVCLHSRAPRGQSTPHPDADPAGAAVADQVGLDVRLAGMEERITALRRAGDAELSGWPLSLAQPASEVDYRINRLQRRARELREDLAGPFTQPAAETSECEPSGQDRTTGLAARAPHGTQTGRRTV